jgi:hypothetical protein
VADTQGARHRCTRGQHTPWRARPDDARQLSYDNRPLHHAVRQGRAHFDIVVIGGSPNWLRIPHVDDFVDLAPNDGVPLVESHRCLSGTETPAVEYPLTPEQSAALLRDRHLRFLPTPPPSFAGLATASATPATQPEPAFLRAVEASLEAVGIPLLGHVHLSPRVQTSCEAPLDEQRGHLNSAAGGGVTTTARAVRELWGPTP